MWVRVINRFRVYGKTIKSHLDVNYNKDYEIEDNYYVARNKIYYLFNKIFIASIKVYFSILFNIIKGLVNTLLFIIFTYISS